MSALAIIKAACERNIKRAIELAPSQERGSYQYGKISAFEEVIGLIEMAEAANKTTEST